MLRKMRSALVMMAVLTAAGEARAQYGYGYPRGYGAYGWGGWGSTPQSAWPAGWVHSAWAAVSITKTRLWPDRSTPTRS